MASKRRPAFPSKQPGYSKPFPLASPMHPETSRRAHINSDVDSGPGAQHHTLGWTGGKAAPGLQTGQKLTELEATLSNEPGIGWTDMVLESPWVVVSVAQFRITAGRIYFRGRIDRAASVAIGSIVALGPQFGETNSSNRICAVISTATGTGTTWSNNAAHYSSANLQIQPGSAAAIQRFLHLDGISFAFGEFS